MNEPPIARLRYCAQHHRVYSIKTRRWHVVAEDFITALRQADLSVDVVAQRCPQCAKPQRPSPPIL
jgi:hypothetical protein